MPEDPNTAQSAPSPLAPGATLGILGGGQLGRMTALAAAALGYRSHIYCPETDCPASQVTPLFTQAAYDDEAALAEFAKAVDVVTFEFENIPHRCVELLANSVAVRPGPEVLAVCQDRLREKDFCGNQGVATARYAAVDGPEALARHLRDFGTPAVLKTTRLGYDAPKGMYPIGPVSNRTLFEIFADQLIVVALVTDSWLLAITSTTLASLPDLHFHSCSTRASFMP